VALVNAWTPSPWAQPALPALLLALGVLVFAGFPASMVFQAAGQSRPLAWRELFACAAAGVVTVGLARWLAPPLVLAATSGLRAAAPARLWPALAVGLTVRLLAMLVIAPAPASDGTAYLALAQGLLANGEYGNAQARAYWPPGLALALVPFLAVAPVPVALGAFALVCFAITGWGLYRLAQSLGLGAWARWPVWLLALWPSHVLMSGLPEKELLVIALLPWVLWAAREAVRHRAWGLLSGAFLGLVVLVQPSFQLLPAFAAVLALLAGQPWRRVASMFCVVVLGAVVVIAPWTFRNLAVLGHPVMVSTNGGSNLYRANNQLATGGYVAVGRVDVEALPELQSDREGKRLAVQWVREHPMDFIRLSLGRVLLFPGDHSYGAYAAFRADPERIPRTLYLAIKAGTAASWLLLWALLVGVAWRQWRARQPLPAGAGWLLLPWLYLSGIHAIFESGSKYHMPTLALMLLLVVLVLHPAGPLASGTSK
jgi:Glycosyltransferase family 87